MHFAEIVHVHRCAKFEVCSYTRFRDTSEGLPNFIGARDPIKAMPRYRILFVPFGEIVRMHPMLHFKSVDCSFNQFHIARSLIRFVLVLHRLSGQDTC